MTIGTLICSIDLHITFYAFGAYEIKHIHKLQLVYEMLYIR